MDLDISNRSDDMWWVSTEIRLCVEARGGSSRPLDKGGGGLPEKCFRPFEPQFGLKRRGRAARAPLLDPPLLETMTKDLVKMTNYVKMG